MWAVVTDDLDPSTSSVVRIDRDTHAVKRIPLRKGSYFSAVTYGQQALLIADAANVENVVTKFGTRDEKIAANVKVATGITDDDIAFADGAVLVWDPDEGWLTRIDAKALRVAKAQQLRGYRTRQAVNREASDLAVDGDAAWVTDPAGDAVHRVTY